MTAAPELRIPCDVDAERAVLVAILRDGERFAEVASRLSGDDFSVDNHRVVFRAMEEIHAAQEAIDRVAVGGKLYGARSGMFPGGPLTFLCDMETGIPDEPNLDRHVRRLRDKTVLRRIQQSGQTIMLRAGELTADPTDLLEQVRDGFLKLSEALQESTLSAPSVIIERAGGLQAFVDRRNRSMGVSTGYSGLDVMTGGFRRGALYILAGRPKMGKSALAMNIAERVAVDAENKVLVFSLEMSEEELITRMICSRAKVNSQRLAGGYLNAEERGRVARAVAEITGSDRVLIDDRAVTTTGDIHSKVRRQAARGPVGLVVVDYLQLLINCRPSERVGAASQISRDLKLIAKDCKCPVLALSQLSRACEERGSDNDINGYRPVPSDLRESGSIEQDADVVMSVFRGEVYLKHRPDRLPEWKGLADLEVMLQRGGPTGVIPMVFLGEYTRFEERAHDPDPSFHAPEERV